MKTLSLLIFTLFFTISAIAQPWIEPTAGNIYYQGNVGIGTTNPGYKLDVIGEIYSSAGFRTTGSLGDDVNGSPWAGLGLSNLTFTGAIGTATQLAGYWGLLLKTSGGTMMMNSTGNIGIGTTNPNSKVVIAEGNNAMSISSGGIGFNRNVNDGQIFNSSISAWQLSTRDDRFTLEGYNGASLNLFTALKNGNVGIGTTNPGGKLEVTGNIVTERLGNSSIRYIGTYYDGNNQFYGGIKITSDGGTGYNQQLDFIIRIKG